jgi:hypothetical protein
MTPDPMLSLEIWAIWAGFPCESGSSGRPFIGNLGNVGSVSHGIWAIQAGFQGNLGCEVWVIPMNSQGSTTLRSVAPADRVSKFISAPIFSQVCGLRCKTCNIFVMDFLAGLRAVQVAGDGTEGGAQADRSTEMQLGN